MSRKSCEAHPYKEKNTRNWVTMRKLLMWFIPFQRSKRQANSKLSLKVILDSIDASSNMWTRTDPRHIHSQIDVNIERDRLAKS